MEFIVVSRKRIEAGVGLSVPHLIVSIRDPGDPPPSIPPNPQCRGILALEFHDAEPSRGYRVSLDRQLFTLKQAEQVWSFIRQHTANITATIIHCEKGLSRSPAIAAALCKVMGGDEQVFFEQYEPNRHVFRTMLKTAGLEEDKEMGT